MLLNVYTSNPLLLTNVAFCCGLSYQEHILSASNNPLFQIHICDTVSVCIINDEFN